MNWQEYADTARHLTEVRRREAQRLARVQERTGGMQADTERLKQRLTTQRTRLLELAHDLRLPAPTLGDAPRSGLTDTDEAGRRAWDAIEHADAAAHQTHERAQQPTLLPGMHPTGRNALIYAATTAIAAVVSCGMVVLGKGQANATPLWTAPWSLCGLPALAFFAGYFVIANFARPRIATGGQHPRSVRLGGLICFLGLWLVWILGISVHP